MATERHERTIPSRMSAYVVAVGATVVVGAIRFLLHGVLGDVAPFMPFVLAVGVAASYGGLRPGLSATALSVIAGVYLLTPPHFSPWVNLAEGLGAALFVVVGVAISWLCEVMHRARQRIESQNLRLEAEVSERVRAEHAERDQRERLQVTLASIGDAVIATDTEGRITNMNPVAESLTGWTISDAMGQPLDAVFRIVNETTRQPVDNPVEKVLKEGVIVGLANHTVLIARDDSERPIDDSAAPIRNTSGQMIGVVLIFRDVSEHRRAEREIRASEARNSAILETALDCVITMDHDGRVVEFNPAAERTFGYTRDQVMGRELADLIIPPSLRERHHRGMAHYLATGEGPVLGTRLELPALRADGSEFPVELAITRIPTDGPPLFTAYVRDISERTSVEQSLRHSEERFRSLMDQAPFSIQVFSPDGRTSRVNRAWEQLWGVTLDQIAGYNILEDQQLAGKGLLPLIKQAFAGEPTFIPAISYDPNETLPGQTRHDDPVRWVAAVAYPLKDDAGAIREVVLVHDDITPRRKAEAALRESEEKLRLLANTIPQLAWMARADGHIFWYNRGWYEYTGTTPEQMEGWGWQSVHHPDALPKVLERWKKSITSGEPFEMVFPLKGTDGQFRPFLTRVNPFRNESGQIVYWFGTNTDIAELREAREALVVSEERLRLALDAGRMGVWDWNIRTSELEWSDSLEPLHGLAPGTFGGTFDHFQQLIYPDDQEAANAAIRHALETAGEFYVEFRTVWPDRSVHWVAGSGKVFTGDDGQPLRMIGIGLDVTQRKRGEQTARFLAEASATLAVLVDFDSTLQKVSSLAVPAFADWATVDLVEADGSLRRVSVSHIDPSKVQLAHDVHRRFPPDPAAPQGVWNVLRTGRSDIVPEITDDLLVRFVNDAELLEIMRTLGLRSYIGVPLIVRGKTLGVITFINAESGHRYDHTDLAVAEDLASRAAIAIENAELYRESREADRRKDEFLATLAHELRNPLAPIRNGLEVIRLSGDNVAAVGQTRSMMERQLSHMVRLVDDLLDVSRISRGKLELRRDRVELAVVVNNAVETSRPVIEASGNELTVVMPPTPVVVDGDVTRLGQIFANLLNNAAKFSEPGGHIRLVAECQGGEVVVSVKDTGVGIPPAMLPTVFDLFIQVDRSLERSQSGLGIGLTLVKKLVEMHGGSVEARSDGHDRGSEFVVRLPMVLTGGREVEPPEGGESVGPSTRRRVLVADDNADSAESLGRLLELLGHEVRTASDGAQAVDVAVAFRPDVILLDIGMPKMNGYEACRRIREQPWARQAVMVALTGWGRDQDRRRSQDAGFDRHMVKPVDPAVLGRLLASVKTPKP